MNLIFIVGVGRSGTSLLQSMFNAHPNVVSLPETHFFRTYIGHSKLKTKIEQQGPVKFEQNLSTNEDFKRVNITTKELLLPYINGSKPFLLEDVYKRLLELYRIKKDKKFIVDKDPKNLEYLTQIYNYFPKAKIIHIIRDPREVVLSKTKAQWSAGRPYWLHSMIGQSQIELGRRKGKLLFGKQYIELYYECLLKNPESELQLICKKANLEFHIEMLQFGRAAKELVSEKEIQWKKETLGSLIKENTNKWKNELTIFQIALIEAISKEYFIKLGYSQSPASNRLSVIGKMKVFIFSFINNIFDLAYNLRLKLRGY